jgi:hypothetical protein
VRERLRASSTQRSRVARCDPALRQSARQRGRRLPSGGSGASGWSSRMASQRNRALGQEARQRALLELSSPKRQVVAAAMVWARLRRPEPLALEQLAASSLLAQLNNPKSHLAACWALPLQRNRYFQLHRAKTKSQLHPCQAISRRLFRSGRGRLGRGHSLMQRS